MHPRKFGLLLALLLCAGVAYMAVFTVDDVVAQKVYIDENALLPGMGSSDIGTFEMNQLRTIEAEINAAAKQGPSGVRTYLQRHMRGLGMDVAESSSLRDDPDAVVSHGVLRAAKGGGTQSVLLVVEYQAEGVSHAADDAPCGLSIGLVLMQHLASRQWLEKDFILAAVPSDAGRRRSTAAFEAWVQRYHTPSLEDFPRGGQILVSWVLEIPRGEPYSTLSVVPGGHHGLSPNLDAISVLLRLLRNHQVPTSVCEARTTPPALLERSPSLPAPLHAHKGLLRCMLNQVTSLETGFHGALLVYSVDALTLRSVVEEPGRHHHWNLHSSLAVLRAMEGSLRAANNLVEKLHHSTSLYILVSTKIFTIMEKYVIGTALFGATLPLYAFALLRWAGTRRYLHSAGVLATVYFICLSALILPTTLEAYMGWHERSLLLCGVLLLLETLIAVLGVLPYLNAAFPPSSSPSPSPSSSLNPDPGPEPSPDPSPASVPPPPSPPWADLGPQPLWREPREDWAEYASLKAFLMLVIILSLSPLAILNFALVLVVFAAVLPLLLPMSPLRRPVLGAEDTTCTKIRAWTAFGFQLLLGLTTLVVLSPPAVLWIGGAVYGVGGRELLWNVLENFPRHSEIHLTTVVMLVYLPAYTLSWILFTLPACTPACTCSGRKRAHSKVE